MKFQFCLEISDFSFLAAFYCHNLIKKYIHQSKLVIVLANLLEGCAQALRKQLQLFLMKSIGFISCVG